MERSSPPPVPSAHLLEGAFEGDKSPWLTGRNIWGGFTAGRMPQKVEKGNSAALCGVWSILRRIKRQERDEGADQGRGITRAPWPLVPLLA